MKQLLYSIFLLSGLSIRAQYTAIPDANFEMALIVKGIDSEGVQDGQVLTADLEGVISLDLKKWNISYGQYVGWDIHDLTGIEAFVNLEYLYINYNPISTIDLSQNTALIRFDASTNPYTGIVDTTVPAYEDLPHPSLGALDLTANTNLEYFYAMRTGLTSVNFGTNSNLLDVLVTDNALTTLDLSGLPNLRSLLCGRNLLTSLDLSHNTLLKTLLIHPRSTATSTNNNMLQAIDLSHNLLLENLYLSGCFDTNLPIFELDLSTFTNLMDIRLWSVPISKVNIANGNNALADFNVDFNYYNNVTNLCVQVDTQTIADAANADTNSWFEAGDVTYSTDCALATVGEETQNTLQVYPNPSTGSYTVSLANAQVASISCYNYLGQQIAKASTNTINITNAKQGLYVLVIKTTSGNVFVEKVMKE